MRLCTSAPGTGASGWKRPTPLAAIVAALVLAACGGDAPADRPHGDMPHMGMRVPATSAEASSDPRAQIFITKGCPQCHSISALGVKSPAEVGPDLTLAAHDVRDRFGVELEEFLEHPTGTMQVVLDAQITLSEAERDSIVRILRSLARESGPNPQQ